MRVQFVAQVFSRMVSASVLTLMTTGQLQSDTALNTTLVLKENNNILDALNSRIATDSNPYNCALWIYRPFTDAFDYSTIQLVGHVLFTENTRYSCNS